MKRIINFGVILSLQLTIGGSCADVIKWDTTATAITNKLTATVTGTNYTTGEKIDETSKEIIINYAGLNLAAIHFNTQISKYKNSLKNIGDLGKCSYTLTDGSIVTEEMVGFLGTRLIGVTHGRSTYLVLRDKLPGATNSVTPFLTARCEDKGNYEKQGGHKYEFKTYIRNTGYKISELLVSPTYFSLAANSDGSWKSGNINVRATNLGYINVSVTGGDVILVGQSEKVIRTGEIVEIYSIPDRYKHEYDTESTGEFYLRGNVGEFGKNTYTVTITHNIV
ncbi:hypothetical protein DDL92_004135 [Escherichia coli]|nr:hypothetical protein [Escherichia coli]